MRGGGGLAWTHAPRQLRLRCGPIRRVLELLLPCVCVCVCSISRGALHGSRCRRLVAAALRQTTEAQTDSQFWEAAIARSLDGEAQTEAQQLAPTADTFLDASAQTEDDPFADTVPIESSPEPTRPVQQTRRAIRRMSFRDSDEGQNQLIWDFVQRGIAIPAMPPVAGNDAWPVLRVATSSSRRLAEGQPYWAFLEPSRGAAPNSRRVRPRRGPPFHTF